MAEQQIHVGDIGTQFVETVTNSDGSIIDLSGAGPIVYTFGRPDGSTITPNGSLLTNGKDGSVVYTTVNDDLNIPGLYTKQVAVTIGSNIWHSEVVQFRVYNNVPWQAELTEILRVMLADLDDDSPTYTDGRLWRALCVAALQVGIEMKFTQNFVVDINAMIISPDPTATDSRDNSYNNLVCLKAASIIERGEVRLASGIMVRDGTSMLDLRSQLQGKLKLLDKGWNAVYEDTKLEYMSGQSRIAGAMVMGPFRLFAGYTDFSQQPYEPRSFLSPFP